METKVIVTGGQTEGYVQDGIYTYLGIPYAQAERFMAPKEPEAWDGIFRADHYGAIAPQENVWGGNEFLYNVEAGQDEDCQNLNIWTPGIRDGKKRPVMVWLHGGGFQTGSSMEQAVYDGRKLSAKGDVVLVSINHRLNVLGFLDLSAYGEKYKDSGNVGMMDIEAALVWIQKNIEQFGGDPDNVTLFGQSGGGAKILTLMAMPSAKGLFHKAIIESGAVESSGMTLTGRKASVRVAELVLEKLGIGQGEIEKLKGVPYAQLAEAGNAALDIVAAEQQIPGPFADGSFSLIWNPVVDGHYIPTEPVGEKMPDISADVPVLIGSNFSEWSTFGMMLDVEKNRADNKNKWSKEETEKRLMERYGEKKAAVVEAFTGAYPEKKTADALFVDALLRTRVLKTAGLKADQKRAAVYTYLFAWETPLYGGFAMSYHCAEIPYVFGNIALSKAAAAGGKDAERLEEQMSWAWIQFARTGNPNHEGLCDWPAYTRENGATMIFDGKSEARCRHDDKLLKLLLPDYAY